MCQLWDHPIYITSSLCENLNYFLPFLSDFLCSTVTFLFKQLMGDILYDWLFGGVNFELKEVTAGFLRGTPGASVIQRDGGFLPDRGRMNGWNQILTAWVPRHATHCSVCSRLACTVYLPFPSLPLASLIVLHRRFVSCSKPLVVKPFCLSVFRSFLYNTPICCSVTPWAPRGQDLSGSAIPNIDFRTNGSNESVLFSKLNTV